MRSPAVLPLSLWLSVVAGCGPRSGHDAGLSDGTGRLVDATESDAATPGSDQGMPQDLARPIDFATSHTDARPAPDLAVRVDAVMRLVDAGPPDLTKLDLHGTGTDAAMSDLEVSDATGADLATGGGVPEGGADLPPADLGPPDLLLPTPLALAFAPPVVSAFCSSMYEMAASDFNGDQKTDLAVACKATNNVAVLLGKGDGSFTGHTVASGTGTTGVAVADFDLDGKIDLAVNATGGLGTVALLLGGGDGTFKSAGSSPVNIGTYLAAADLNGDGISDLVGSGNGYVVQTILVGAGATLGAPGSYVTGGRNWMVATADFNGDGALDFVGADYDNANVTVLLGKGDGSFGAAAVFATPSPVHWVATADFNGDGKTDIAAVQPGKATPLAANNLSLLFGKGDGSFAPALTSTAGSGPAFVVAGDFNLDAKPDLAVAAGGSQNLLVLLNKGGGGFQAPIVIGGGIPPTGLVAADFNADGKTDLSVGHQTASGVAVFLNTSK